MKKIFSAFFLLFSLSAFAQDNKELDNGYTQKRVIMGSFNAIEVTDGIDLFLTQGTADSLMISAADEKYFARFKTDVINGTLKIYYESKGIKWVSGEKGRFKAYLTFKSLEKLMASSGSTVNLKNKLELGDLDLQITSGAVFNGGINAKLINVAQNSGAVVNISGKADKMVIVISSGGMFKGYELAVDNCIATSSSGANVQITINKELTATVSSGGGIHYKGDALIRDISKKSGGVVKRG